ncbi:Fanconi anemia group M protein [Vanrija pseudolonga]|uniref:ATP-dependent DNA helicase n=1 Tax=Vanrija pseudolonga TaxID=143232 RepID=A0AAF0Y921_9TREE|nr:Fanconi anemia group M protein [Vanrija pseudolonga]
MSDYDEFDAFDVDESFLREVEEVEKRAVAPRPPARPPNAGAAARAAALISYADPHAGPSSRAAALGVRPAAPPSDDYDMTFELDPAALAQIDSVASAVRAPANRRLANGTTLLPTTSRDKFARTTSGSAMFQTHLGFRRQQQYTKGKRWDRTAFAASGRRVAAEKEKEGRKKKGKRKRGEEEDEDDEDEEEEDWGEPLVPPPKPLVDISKPYGPQTHLFSRSTIKDYIYPTNHPKRDYQFEIIRACFTDNCLVALPTGLGKTFIAGVVMLNCGFFELLKANRAVYRWFPSGKIVFLAPTKPLVNQQIEACQLTCGIPSADAAVMTGSSVTAKQRARLTLENDLKRGAVDPRDIVLAVFDEAHKASGSYSYTTILAYITAHHPYFRVLALTATPGGDVPKVQGVVDALHISRIEIREAEAPEIRKYMNEKVGRPRRDRADGQKTDKHVVRMSPVIVEFRDRWATVMKPFIAKLVERNILTERDLDAKRLRPFRLTAKRMELSRDRSSGATWAFGPLNNLEKMARAMLHLLEFSLGMFHTTLLEISGGSAATGKKGNTKAGANSIRTNIEFQRLTRDVEGELNDIRQHTDGKMAADRHPKMVKTLELLLAHFAQAEDDEKTHGVKSNTRAMVFCSFRECVLEIVDMLNEHPDLLRATKFVGQSQGKQLVDKGFNQKEQKSTINEFKEGKFNILVSTSIGEEGLDIGEVDFVIIYDMPKQAIKLLQRVGRTGRKRDGNVHVLMSEGREEFNHEAAQQTHREIQEEILHSRNLELFEDVERLLPPGPLPAVLEQEMEVDPWDPADQKQKVKLAAASQKPTNTKSTTAKRGHDIPDDAHKGFKTVAELLKESAAKKKRSRKADPLSDESEEEVIDLSGRLESDNEDEDDTELLYGNVATSRMGSGPSQKVARARGAKKARLGSRSSSGATSSAKSKKSQAEEARRLEEAERLEEKQREEERRQELNRSALEFFRTQGLPRNRTPSPTKSSPGRCTPPSSPHAHDQVNGNGTRLSPSIAAAAGFSQLDGIWDDDDEDLGNVFTQRSPPPSPPQTTMLPPATAQAQRTAPLVPSRSTDQMPPPPVPHTPFTGGTRRFNDSPMAQSPFASGGATQFPVRRPGHRAMPLFIPSSDPPDESPGPRPLQRLRRRVTSSSPAGGEPAVAPPRARRPRQAPGAVRQMLDLDAGVSGSESSDEASSDEETKEDRLFADDFQATQAPAGYNQRAVYAAGLSTQVGSRMGLQFRNSRDERHQAFLGKARAPVLVSDEERSSDNEYELGSFVCDDEDVSFVSQSDPLGSGL